MKAHATKLASIFFCFTAIFVTNCSWWDMFTKSDSVRPQLSFDINTIEFDTAMEFNLNDPFSKSKDPIVQLCRSLFEKNKRSLGKAQNCPIIPKKIHLIWLGPKTPPIVFKDCLASLKKNLPDWEFKLWTDADVPSLDLYNQKYFDEETNYAAKSDILRYEILYRFGGVYIDVDIEVIQSLDILKPLL